jgi:hypothetical protein
MSSIGVLIHGCHLQAEEWENIVWGDPARKVLGRVPAALSLLLKEPIDLFYWGTGASRKDGLLESEYTINYARDHMDELTDLIGLGQAGISDYLQKASFVDRETQNTTEEIRRAAMVCREQGIDQLILVSSPTHIARCLQEAMKLRADGVLRDIDVFATASDTCFAGSTPGDVVVMEPPHRGDLPKIPFHRTARRIFQFLRNPEAAEGFNREWNELIDTWEQRL